MGIRKILFLLFVFTFLLSKAQFPDKKYYLVDSLTKTESNSNDFKVIEGMLKQYHTASSDTSRLIILASIVESTNDPNIWSKYNRLLYNTSDLLINKTEPSVLRNKFLSKKAQAINNYGYYLQNYTGKPEASLQFYYDAEKIQKSINDKHGLVISKNNIANLLYENGKVLMALEIFQEAIKIQEQLKDPTGLTPLLNNLAETYMFLGDTSKAYVYLKSALASYIQSGDKQIMAQELQNVGVLASYRGQEDYAMNCIKKALAIREQIGDVVGFNKSKLNIATIYLRDKDFAGAKRYIDQTEKPAEESDNLTLKYLFHTTAGQYYFDINDYKKSEYHHLLGWKYTQDAKSVQEETKSVKFLLDLYQVYANNEKELLVYRRKEELSKILNSAEIRRTALRKEYETEYEERESEIKVEQAIKDEKNRLEKRRQSYIIIGISVILAITLFFFYAIYKAFNRIKQKNKIISLQKREVEKAKQLVEHKQTEILDSIKYAKRIQQSLLPTEKYIDKSIRSMKKTEK